MAEPSEKCCGRRSRFRRPRPGRRARCGRHDARRSWRTAATPSSRSRERVGVAVAAPRCRWNGSPSDRRAEPSGQRQLGVVHDRAGRERGLLAAAGAAKCTLGVQRPRLAAAATGAGEAAGSAPRTGIDARRLIWEVLLELDQGAGEVGICVTEGIVCDLFYHNSRQKEPELSAGREIRARVIRDPSRHFSLSLNSPPDGA